MTKAEKDQTNQSTEAAPSPDLEKTFGDKPSSPTADTRANSDSESDSSALEAPVSLDSEAIAAEEESLEGQLDTNGDYLAGYDEDVYDLGQDSDPAARLERIKTIKSLSDDIPDKFVGWGLTSTIATAIINSSSWGAGSAWALYLQKFLNDNVFDGVSKLEYGAIGGLLFGSGLTFAPFINYLAGKLGIRKTMLIGAAIQFLGVFTASFTKELWQLYLSEGVLQGVGMAMVAVPSVVILPQWFKGGPGGKRNAAVGIGAAGSGIGGIIYNVGMEPIMTKHSWRWALRTQSIMCFVLTIVATFMLKSRNKDVKPIYKVYDKLVWSNFGIRMMILWTAVTLLGYVTLMFNLADFTRSMGYGSNEAAVVSAMIAVGIIWGRPMVGFFGDIIGPIQVTIIADFLVALFAFAMWLPCKNYATAIVLAMLEGSLMGSIWVTMSTMNGAIIGLRKFGIGMSVAWIAVGIFGTISPIIGIVLKSPPPVNRRQYLHPTIFVGCSYVAAGVTLCFLRAWIIARSKHTEECKSEDSRLRIRVAPSETLRCFFEIGPKV